MKLLVSDNKLKFLELKFLSKHPCYRQHYIHDHMTLTSDLRKISSVSSYDSYMGHGKYLCKLHFSRLRVVELEACLGWTDELTDS